MNINDLDEDFKITIDTFVKVSKSRSENESSLEFHNHLKKYNSEITFTGNQKGGEFEQVFRGKQPNFTSSIASQFYACPGQSDAVVNDRILHFQVVYDSY
jgi:hypothetical protein